MPDNKTKTGGQDRKRIGTSQDYEVRDWAAKFGVTKEQHSRLSSRSATSPATSRRT